MLAGSNRVGSGVVGTSLCCVSFVFLLPFTFHHIVGSERSAGLLLVTVRIVKYMGLMLGVEWQPQCSSEKAVKHTPLLQKRKYRSTLLLISREWMRSINLPVAWSRKNLDWVVPITPDSRARKRSCDLSIVDGVLQLRMNSTVPTSQMMQRQTGF
mmetsp:Transcript_4964/g.9872  ORF Transcript_4964/g.9872 Transcript_4964/m.9872 type:complete len:155 (-) Transcript_4964:734-1198(-)